MFDHIFHLAVQRLAEGVQRAGADGQAVLDAVEGVGGKALLVDKIILCDPLLEQGVVKRFITNHKIHRN